MPRRSQTSNRPEFQRVYRDTELNILHSKKECPYARMADKYNYLENVTGTDHLEARARGFGWKACPKCGDGLMVTLKIVKTKAVKRR